MLGAELGPENTKILNRSVSTSGSSKSNERGTGIFNLRCNIRNICWMFWKCIKCVSNAVPEWDNDLGMSSGKGDLNWILSKSVIYVDIEAIE